MPPWVQAFEVNEDIRLSYNSPASFQNLAEVAERDGTRLSPGGRRGSGTSSLWTNFKQKAASSFPDRS